MFVDHCPKTSPPPRRVLGELVLKGACGGGSSFAGPVGQPTAGADPQAVSGSSRTPGSGHQDVGTSCWTPFEDSYGQPRTVAPWRSGLHFVRSLFLKRSTPSGLISVLAK